MRHLSFYSALRSNPNQKNESVAKQRFHFFGLARLLAIAITAVLTHRLPFLAQ
jgi:hypothetical protein